MNDFIGDDVFDGRDVVARIDDIRAELDIPDDAKLTDDELAEALELEEELETLLKFQEEAEKYGEDSLGDGVSFIKEEYFRYYAEDLADQIGVIDADAAWPSNYIDWDAASEALQSDYTSIEIDGYTYWYR